MPNPYLSNAVRQKVQQVSGVLGAIAIGLSGCTTTPPSTSDSSLSSDAGASDAGASDAGAASTEQLQVITTFLPMTQFTTAVAGDRADVIQLLPTTVGPHDFQAKPADVQAIANADVLVKNGLEMELFLDALIENAENSDLLTIDTSEGISALASEGDDEHGHGTEKAEADDEHDDHGHHEHDEHDEHDDQGHDEGHKDAESDHSDHADDTHAHTEADDPDSAEEKAHGHSEHAHGEFDPHIWLDPKRAIEQVENIRDGLIVADPEGEGEYTANAAAFIADLQNLDAEITTALSPFSGQTFVVFHNFAAYFADSYGLDSEILVALPDENPAPEDVKRVIETVQAEGLKTIMTEPQAGGSSFAALAQDLGVSVSVFDSLEIGEPDAMLPEAYLEIMRQNANNLADSFGG